MAGEFFGTLAPPFSFNCNSHKRKIQNVSILDKLCCVFVNAKVQTTRRTRNIVTNLREEDRLVDRRVLAAGLLLNYWLGYGGRILKFWWQLFAGVAGLLLECRRRLCWRLLEREMLREELVHVAAGHWRNVCADVEPVGPVAPDLHARLLRLELLLLPALRNVTCILLLYGIRIKSGALVLVVYSIFVLVV